MLGSYSTGSGCADAKATAEGRMTLISLTATIKAGTPPTPPPKEKTPSLNVALSLVGAPTLLTPGDTPDVKVTVSAGEEVVHNVKFSGNALRVTGSAVEITGGPMSSRIILPRTRRVTILQLQNEGSGDGNVLPSLGRGRRRAEGEALELGGDRREGAEERARLGKRTTKPSRSPSRSTTRRRFRRRRSASGEAEQQRHGRRDQRSRSSACSPAAARPDGAGRPARLRQELLPIKVGSSGPA